MCLWKKEESALLLQGLSFNFCNCQCRSGRSLPAEKYGCWPTACILMAMKGSAGGLFAALLLCSATLAERSAPAYQSPDLPVSERVADLLARMTPQELAHQLVNKNEGGWGDLPGILGEFGATGIGTLFVDEVMNKSAWGHANASQWSTPLEALRARNALQAAFMTQSRLGIPVSFCMEGLHSGAWGGTVFPGPPSLASAWNASLVTAIGATIALEARATGVDTALSPVVNMFSVSPCLQSRAARAYTRPTRVSCARAL